MLVPQSSVFLVYWVGCTFSWPFLLPLIVLFIYIFDDTKKNVNLAAVKGLPRVTSPFPTRAGCVAVQLNKTKKHCSTDVKQDILRFNGANLSKPFTGNDGAHVAPFAPTQAPTHWLIESLTCKNSLC